MIFCPSKASGQLQLSAQGKWTSTITEATLIFCDSCTLFPLEDNCSAFLLLDCKITIAPAALWSCNIPARTGQYWFIESNICGRYATFRCSLFYWWWLMVVMNDLKLRTIFVYILFLYTQVIYCFLFKCWQTRTPWTSLHRVPSPKAPSWIAQSHQPEGLEQRTNHVKKSGVFFVLST